MNVLGQIAPVHRKVVLSAREAVAGIHDGAVLLVGGWGGIGVPEGLILALKSLAPQNLTVVTNNCGMGNTGDVGELFNAGMVVKAITTFPVHLGAVDFRAQVARGEVEVELTPQGTLAERLRSAGAGLGGFYTPTGVGTLLADGKECRVIEGKDYIFEESLSGDFAVIKAAQADPMGNLRFRYAARSFNPLMAMAAKRTIVQVDELVELGEIAPDDIHLPGIFVDQIYVSEDQK